MSTSVVPGQLITEVDPKQLAEEAASRLGQALREAIAQRGSASIALSGGNTPRPAYERLARQAGIDWSRVSVFFIDERAVPPTHERSNYRLAKESLLDNAPIPAANVHRMRGEAADLDQAAREYEALLKAHLKPSAVDPSEMPSFDVAVMGIGDDGHTASLFPGDPSVDVRDRLTLAIAAAPDTGREARLTVTAPIIENIRTVVVLAAGKAKHGPLERIWSVSGTTQETPSRILRDVKGSITWIIDKGAAGVE
jgi:6-phosphogluconolactonase